MHRHLSCQLSAKPAWWHCELFCHLAPCGDLSGDIAHECGACPSQAACNPCADGSVYSEHAELELKRHNEALQRRVVRRRIRKRQAALRPQTTLSSGCVVYEHAQLNASLLIANNQPAILRGIVSRDVRRAVAKDTLRFFGGADNPQHVVCKHRRPSDEYDPSSGACDWARDHLYNLPLWHGLWNGQTPKGTAILCGSRGVGFHSQEQTLNALFTSRRHWFIFDAGSDEVHDEIDVSDKEGLGGWQALPLLRSLALNKTRNSIHGHASQRTGRVEDWLRFAYPHRAASGSRAAFECVQRAGEVLYVPKLFHRAMVGTARAESRSVFIITARGRPI